MKLWKLAATVALGVFASGSGILQVSAADFLFDVNFDDKIVADFDDYKRTFIETTADFGNRIEFTIQGTYSMNNCDLAAPSNASLALRYQPNATGLTITVASTTLGIPCSTTEASYFNYVEAELDPEVINLIIADDAEFVVFRPLITFFSSAAAAATGRVITFSNINILYTVNYEFNTTYLFNYFLSDTKFNSVSYSAAITGTPDIINNFDYVMTTAGNDRYFLVNTATTDYGSDRTKFAIDYNEEYFRGDSVGARYTTRLSGNLSVPIQASGNLLISILYNYYYLNVSNKEQDIANVPTFEFEQEDCGWDAFNIPCFINNGLAYIVNDAPVISDAFTLLNAGMKLGGQAFGIIGNFTTDNLFGVMILGGLGITAVRWFLKND
jgi:hypothetical protein